VKMRAHVVIASDSRSAGAREDRTGPAAERALEAIGVEVAGVHVVPDDLELLAEKLTALVSDETIALVLTSGGTGLSPRDVTPEATRRVIDREVPGIPEMLRFKSLAITPRAPLSRAVAGVKNRTLIINLPGSPKAVQESIEFLAPLLPHALETVTGEAVECAETREAKR
jgi:molybdopterin adenylyltransferase